MRKLLLLLAVLWLAAPAFAQGDHIVRCVRLGSATPASATCLCRDTSNDNVFLDRDCDATQDTEESSIAHETHATDCTALSCSGTGSICYEQDANTMYVCEAGTYTAITAAAVLTTIDADYGIETVTSDWTMDIISGKQQRNTTSVDDDSCVGEQGLWWYDDTDSQFEFCNLNSGAPSTIAAVSGDITDVFDCATGDCNAVTVESGDSLSVDAGGISESTATHLSVYNDSGATLFECTAVYISGFDVPSNLPEVSIADADNAAAMPAVGLIEADIANAATGKVVMFGAHAALDTSTGEAWSVADALYVNDSGTSADTDCGNTLTNTRPANTDDAIQKVGTVDRVHATTGRIVVSGANRSNDVPNLTDATFWVGNGSNVATAVAMSSDATMANTGAVTVVDDSHAHVITNIDAFTVAELQTQTSDVTTFYTEDTTVPVEDGGTGAATFTDGGILLGSGTGAITALGAAANGEIPIGDGTTDPVLATITGTANEITVTNGAGTITLDIPTSPTLDGTNFSGVTHTETESWIIYSGVATAGDDLLVHTNAAITLVSLDCTTTGATTPTETVTVVECTSAGATCVSSGLVASMTTNLTLVTDDSPTDAAIDANDWWGLDMTTLTTEGDVLNCTVEYTRVD